MRGNTLKTIRRDREQQVIDQAEAAFDAGDFKKALRKFLYYLRFKPTDGDVLYNVGVLTSVLSEGPKDYAEAAKFFDECVSSPEASQETKSDAMNYLGILMEKVGRTDQAAIAYHFALQINPDNAAALCNMGDCLRAECKWAEADEQFEKALKLNPDQPDAKMSRGMIQLLMGNFREGWANYEQRWDVPTFPTKRFQSNKPRWDGKDISGKRILLTQEQGFGDTIQFIRYAEPLRDLGADVWFFGSKEMCPLIETAKGVSKAIWQLEVGGLNEPWDCHCPLLSLPALLDTNTEEDIRSFVPYFETSMLKPFGYFKPAGPKRIGLVWAGSPRHGKDKARSTNVDDWNLFTAHNPGVEFISFQVGPRWREVERLFGVRQDIAREVASWDQTAAALSNIDALISVDTAVAHLAGALGKKVFLLVPHSPDWRWMLGRSDSPWYPGHELFRQPQPGNWISPMLEINERLKTLCQRSFF